MSIYQEIVVEKVRDTLYEITLIEGENEKFKSLDKELRKALTTVEDKGSKIHPQSYINKLGEGRKLLRLTKEVVVKLSEDFSNSEKSSDLWRRLLLELDEAIEAQGYVIKQIREYDLGEGKK